MFPPSPPVRSRNRVRHPLLPLLAILALSFFTSLLPVPQGRNPSKRFAGFIRIPADLVLIHVTGRTAFLERVPEFEVLRMKRRLLAAARLVPEREVFYTAGAWGFLAWSRPADALSLLRTGLERHPESLPLRRTLAMVLALTQSDTSARLAVLRRATDFPPRRMKAALRGGDRRIAVLYKLRARLEEKAGHPEIALRIWEKLASAESNEMLRADAAREIWRLEGLISETSGEYNISRGRR
ncbi:MAG: hypothetical protein D6679_04995 [Candidatus Hydrogenedentota bacterium]|nr:MAG: hypothetical protein D6679_04995 [Candidatus Hydrogenedentota bacterium]